MQYSHYDIIQDIYVMSTAHISYCKVKSKGCKKSFGYYFYCLKAFNDKSGNPRNEDSRNAFNVHCEYNEIIPYLFLRMNSLEAIFIDKNQA